MAERAPPAGGRNRLADSTSPYLRQHAENPVHWFEWGPEALAQAREQDKPILLSVGYSACHWCHVMAHESFEDDATAALLNEHYISIKVDREERPDIDAIYQKVVQLMGEGGGWPLTVFMTPEQDPFYGGTYFPTEPRFGRPGFSQLLRALADAYANKRQDVDKQVGVFRQGLVAIRKAFDHGDPADAETLAAPESLVLATGRLVQRVDPTWGGFGRQPKFPNPTGLEILLRVARGDAADDAVADARKALRLTLDKMYQGGIYDHLRGGFARYSVDRVWLVPHFEKMLYDNAQLLPLYAEAAALWPEAQHLAEVARDTVAYLLEDMRAPSGLFYAATDADSEGEEGKYFVWSRAEVRETLGDESLAGLVCSVYDVTEAGNFEGRSIFNLKQPLEERAAAAGLSRDALERKLGPAREKLLAARYKRVPPSRDDKELTAWNALLATGLCRAGAALDAQDWFEVAAEVVTALLDAHVQSDGKVMRAGFEGRVHTRGYADDVAYLGRACIDLHEVTRERKWIEHARSLAQHLVAAYAREDGDGLYLTANDAERLIERTESQHDGPIPSALGVAVELLLRLEAAGAGVDAGQQTALNVLARLHKAADEPFMYASLLTAAAHASTQAMHVTVRAKTPSDAAALSRIVLTARLRLPHPVTLSYEPGDVAEAIVCQAGACGPPLDGAALADALTSGPR